MTDKRIGLIILFLLSVVPGRIFAASPLSEKQFDDILSAIGGGVSASSAASPNIDAVMGAMSDQFDLDAIYESMNPELASLNAIADMMTIDGTLDYLSRPDSKSAFASYGTRPYNRPALAGRAVLPVVGMITSRYGFRPKYNRMHKGIDIAVNVGDTIRAAMDGTILRVDNEPKGYGIFVVMRHTNGMETRYAHLSRTLVWPGERVMAGRPIALGGSTGNSTGPHLHFETRIANQAIDPSTMFDFASPAMAAFTSAADLEPEHSSVYTYDPDNLQTPYSLASTGAKAIQPIGEKSTYIVKVGDTLASVSRATGLSVYKICSLNMLSSGESLQPGRMLRLR